MKILLYLASMVSISILLSVIRHKTQQYDNTNTIHNRRDRKDVKN